MNIATRHPNSKAPKKLSNYSRQNSLDGFIFIYIASSTVWPTTFFFFQISRWAVDIYFGAHMPLDRCRRFISTRHLESRRTSVHHTSIRPWARLSGASWAPNPWVRQLHCAARTAFDFSTQTDVRINNIHVLIGARMNSCKHLHTNGEKTQ